MQLPNGVGLDVFEASCDLFVKRAVRYCWHQAAVVVALHWILHGQHPVVGRRLDGSFSHAFIEGSEGKKKKMYSDLTIKRRELNWEM